MVCESTVSTCYHQMAEKVFAMEMGRTGPGELEEVSLALSFLEVWPGISLNSMMIN